VCIRLGFKLIGHGEAYHGTRILSNVF
jgi:hypothetical protein